MMESILDWADLAGWSEEEQIRILGKAAMESNKPIAICMHDETKANEYAAKVTARFPEVVEIDRFADTPVDGMWTIRMGTRPTDRLPGRRQAEC